MSTLYEEIYELFFDKLEKDVEFFNLFNLTETEALELATTRAKKYLMESIAYLILNCTPDVDFYDKDDILGTFNFEVTPMEKDLITSIMREKYFEKDLLLLKAFGSRLTPKDLNSFSPSADRKSFVDMLDGMRNINILSIRNYVARDRLTGKLKMIKFTIDS